MAAPAEGSRSRRTAPKAGTFISFDGSIIAYRTYGEAGVAIPLICCSGIACNEVYFRSLGRRLARDRMVVTWDYPYHGDSSPAGDPKEISVRSLARHGLALLDHLGIERAALAGHSMGVQVMFEVYRLAAARVGALVAIAGPYQHTVGHLYGTGIGHTILNLMIAGARLNQPLASITWKLLLTPQLADPFGRLAGLIGRAPVEIMNEYLTHLAGMDLRPLLDMFKAGHEHSAEDLLEKVHVPTLILHGTADVMTPFALAEEMARRLHDSELVAVEGGAHTLPAEDPQMISREIGRFLAKRAGG